MSKRTTTKKRSKADWKHLDATREGDIDFSDISPMTPEMFAKSVVRAGLKPRLAKEQITLRLDTDVLEWFRARGAGYQTQINALLRAYMNEHLRPR